ncbi:MAG: hypothetical protein N3F09_09625 [Bacteroidia bacterium]|nr:hypothetical protein [Bacteroidia bacterium]
MNLLSQDSLLARLKNLQPYAFHIKNHEARLDSHKVFLEIMKNIANSEHAYAFPFHELKDISTLEDPDRSFKLITWNQILKDKSHAFFGFLIKKNKNKKSGKEETVTFYLKDISQQIKNPESHTGSADKWYGMLYYKLIPCEDYYILFGWDGNDGITQKKFIDVLWFKDGEPVFGKDVFKIPRRSPRRIQFEYSADVTMSLKYIPEKKLIVYSHNSPFKEDLDFQGLYQYYGPDGSFDGFYYSKNKWKPVEDLDIRLEKSKNDKVAKPDIKKQKKLYEPK